jgi:hypothetical protein
MTGRVVWEIGAGRSWSAARRAVGDGLYVASDVVTDLDGSGVGHALVRADGRRLPLRNHSVERVVVKNVLGDPGLGETLESGIGRGDLEPSEYRQYLVDDVLAAGQEEIARVGNLILETRQRVRATKVAILDEVARVLAPSGRAAVIETMTPGVAAAFLRSERLPPSVELASVKSFGRRRRWCTDDELAAPGLRVWLLTARPRVEPHQRGVARRTARY